MKETNHAGRYITSIILTLHPLVHNNNNNNNNNNNSNKICWSLVRSFMTEEGQLGPKRLSRHSPCVCVGKGGSLRHR